MTRRCGGHGTAASLVGVFYASLAVRRSDALLRRLVVYPFRELDSSFARLNGQEQVAIQCLYPKTSDGQVELTNRILTELRAERPGMTDAMIDCLCEQGWIIGRQDGSQAVNQDRAPYMAFLREASRKEIADA
jgi:hypothetical protein